MYGWDLPEDLEIDGQRYRVRTDFRAILDIMAAFNDPDLPAEGKAKVLMEILFVDIPPVDHLEEAYEMALWFLDGGKEWDDKPRPRTMDWEQDAPIIFPAVNKVAGYETRNPQISTHWWTFLGYFEEISEGLFSHVLSIRQKKAKGKKLEKWEQEFYLENQSMVNLKANLTEEERDLRRKEQDAVDALFK